MAQRIKDNFVGNKEITFLRMPLHHHHERDASIQNVLLKKMKCCGLLMEAYLGKYLKYKLG